MTAKAHQSILLADDGADRGRAADAHGSGWHDLLGVPDELGERRDHLVGGAVATGSGYLASIQHYPTEADAGGRDTVDLDGERIDVEPFRLRPHHERGAPGPPVVTRHLLANQADRREVGR